MAIESINKFYEACSKCEWLIEDLKRAQSLGEAIGIANEAGYEFNEDELKEYARARQRSRKLSDDELEAVAGGMTIIGRCPGKFSVNCFLLGCTRAILEGRCTSQSAFD